MLLWKQKNYWKKARSQIPDVERSQKLFYTSSMINLNNALMGVQLELLTNPAFIVFKISGTAS